MAGTDDHRTALAPDLRALADRAVRAWTERMAVRPLGGGQYAVDSESDATYVVDLPARNCDCPDHEMRDTRCKHIRRVAIEITAGRAPPPGKRAVPCGVCGTETFVPEAESPPHCCAVCALDPGAVVLDRETGDRLVVERVTAAAADAYRIRATGDTVAAHPTNDGYPADDLVVEAVYLADAARHDDPRTYAFPRSRLRRADDADLVDA